MTLVADVWRVAKDAQELAGFKARVRRDVPSIHTKLAKALATRKDGEKCAITWCVVDLPMVAATFGGLKLRDWDGPGEFTAECKTFSNALECELSDPCISISSAAGTRRTRFQQTLVKVVRFFANVDDAKLNERMAVFANIRREERREERLRHVLHTDCTLPVDLVNIVCVYECTTE